MEHKLELEVIAHIRTDFKEKFGIPRQSGLVDGLLGVIEFEPKYRNPDAVKGLEGFEYIWLLWAFEDTKRERWAATVTPPKLGGRETMGVFATRSPFRPNPIGLSSVKLEKVDLCEGGPVLAVSGADLRDNTPIYDIKPYLPYTDSHPGAKAGFSDAVGGYELEVIFPEKLLMMLPAEKRIPAIHILEQDPRPAYHNDSRRYGVSFAGYDIHFTVCDKTLTVSDVVKL